MLVERIIDPMDPFRQVAETHPAEWKAAGLPVSAGGSTS